MYLWPCTNSAINNVAKLIAPLQQRRNRFYMWPIDTLDVMVATPSAISFRASQPRNKSTYTSRVISVRDKNGYNNNFISLETTLTGRERENRVIW